MISVTATVFLYLTLFVSSYHVSNARLITKLLEETQAIVAGGYKACECGTKGSARIVDGVQVAEGEIPWQVGLQKTKGPYVSQYCGGTLVSDTYVITAAHCISYDTKFGRIFMGSVDLQSSNSVTRKMAEVIVHPEYNTQTQQNDITIIKLAEPVKFSDTVFPACLPKALVGKDLTGLEVTVSGWGALWEGGQSSQKMMKVKVKTVSNKDCKAKYRDVVDSNLCAAARGKDSCQGDSGGPLIYKQNGIFYHVGVVSYGKGCARPEYPGVYARVTSYLDWINKTSGNSICTK